MIDFDPVQRGWQRHAIRPCIQPCCKVQDQVNALLDLPDDEVIEGVGARYP
jgi:hypothetical protein